MAHYIDDDEGIGIEGEESMLLDEEMDDDYEPSDQEIIEYAQFLGMDLKEDKDLLYIAKEGLKAPLPENFKPYKRRDGEIVYVNLETNEFQEEHPCDEYYRGLYLEAKRKKNQKQTNSKFKKNFPIGGNAAATKGDPFPSVQPLSHSNKTGNKGISNLDKSHASDQQDSFVSNNQDSSFSGMPVPLINKDKKKADGSETKASIVPLEYEGQIKIEEVDQEYEDNFFEHYKKKEKELTTFKKELKEQEEDYEENINKKTESALKALALTLNEEASESKSQLLTEKEKIKEKLKNEYLEKFEADVKKLDKQHFGNKRELNKIQENKIKEELLLEEENQDKNFRNKEQSLENKKKDLESELELIRKQEERIKERIYEDLDFEKENIIQNYKKRQRDFESTQRVHQEEVLRDYSEKELQSKLKEEIKILENAKQQKMTLALTQREELKENYERKFILKKEKLDLQMNEDLKHFEEKEKIRKDQEIIKIQNLELRQSKDKKKNQLNSEVIQLEENYKKRLKNYQEVLQKKFEKEIELIEEEAEKSVQDTKKQVENIKLDISNKDEIFQEVQRLQSNEGFLNEQLQEYEHKNLNQKGENKELQEKLKMKQNTYFGVQDYAIQVIEELKKEINEKDIQLARLHKERKIKQNPQSPQKPLIRNKSVSKDTSNLAISKIMKELKEIKSFILPSEEEKSNSYFKTFYNEIHPKTVSKSFLKKENSNKKSKLLSNNKLIDDWVLIYKNEVNKIELLKQEMKKDKLLLKKLQEQLIEEQEIFKENFNTFKASKDHTREKKYTLREQKRLLNDYVKKINDDVYRLRENESLLKEKEKSLENIGKMIQKSSERGSDLRKIIFFEKLNSTGSVGVAYKHYQELEFEYQPPLTKQIQMQDLTTQVEQHEFYKKWESLVENQQSLDVSENEEHGLPKENQSFQNYTEALGNYPRQDTGYLSEQKSNQFQTSSFKNAPYDYKNRIKILDLKLRAGLNGFENDYVKRQMYQSTESRYKMNEVFTQQSQWLKDMKVQLNSQLYDKASINNNTTTSVLFSRYL